jgi:hypothetical protein
MSDFMSHYMVPIAIGAVAIVQLMRLRVLLQFVAIIVIMATIWVMKG